VAPVSIGTFRERFRVAVVAVVALVVLLAAPFVGAATREPAPVVLAEGFSSQPLGKRALVALDRTGVRTIDDVRRALSADDPELPFEASGKDAPNLSYVRGAAWCRVRLEDRRATVTPLVLDVEYAPLDFVDAYAVIDGVAVHLGAAGDHVPHASWPRATTFPSFTLPAARALELWIRVQGDSSLQIPAVLRTDGAAVRDEQARAVAQALYYGALLAMGIYNLLVFASTRSRAYLFYVAFLASHGTMLLGLSGVGYAAFWSPLQPFADMVIPRAIACTGAAGIFFARSLLRAARDDRRLRRAADAVLVVLGATFASSFVFRCGPVTRVALGATLVWAVFMVTTGVVAMRRGERVARFYLLAWAFFAVGGASQALVNLAVLPSTAVTRNIATIGSALEFLLLSFALADRLKTLQLEATANAELAATNARVAQEATERSLAELQRLDRVKDEFLANTSHELRTPIHGVTGVLEALLARPSLGATDRQDVRMALASAHRLSGLVSAVLDFSQFRSGAMTVDRRPVNLAAIVEAEAAARRSDAKVPIQVGALERALAAHGDEARLRQLVAQLVANAVKFTAAGAIDLTLVEHDGSLVLEVRDTGIGIAPERLEALFQGLEQGDGSATREAGGLGIGLALAKRIAEAHGGELVVRSQAGAGTTVRVRLPGTREPVAAAVAVPRPVARVADVADVPADDGALLRMTSLIPPRADRPRDSIPAAPRPRSPARASALAPLRSPRAVERSSVAPPSASASTTRDDEAPPSSHGIVAQASDAGVRILVADDDPMNRRVIRLQLAPLGFELVEAEDGADAMAKVEGAGPFDAVLLDVMMPKASGYDVCRKIRETKSATELPVLMLTAKAQVRDLLEGFEAGANDYVPKPFSKAELLARIRTHVTMARTHQSLRRFVPQGALEILGHENVVDVRLGDTTERELAVLFSDVRGFSGLSQKRTPAEIFALLNQCYARIGPAVRAAGGFVDKYIGDGLMALFPNGAEAAVRAAVAMQRALAEPIEGEELRIGLGIHVGPTMLGTLGEPDRFDATVISDAVNLASRIEGASKQLGAKLLVSRATYEALAPGAFEARGLGRVQVKGREGYVEVVEILDAEEPELAHAKGAAREAFALALGHFHAGEWREAHARFARLAAECSEDLASGLYAEACARADAGDRSAIGAGASLVLLEK
jgi:signal transduction histidine kinase/class 3 adenylate cyclase